MAFDREELDAIRPKQDKAATRLSLTGYHQAALKADAVTGDPAWDFIGSLIQRAIEAAQQQKAKLQAEIMDPKVVDEAKVRAARNAIFQLDERIRSLEWVITIPAELKQAGKVAAEKLKEMDLEEAEGEVPDAA